MSVWRRARVKSSPISTTTRTHTAIGCIILQRHSAAPLMSGSAAPTCRPPVTGLSPNASPARQAIHCMFCCLTRSPSTSPAATWPIARRHSSRLAASTRASAPLATMLTFAGGCRTAAGQSASARLRWCGTTGATRLAPSGSSNMATARPRRCNALGHIGWAGRIYACGPGLANLFRQRIYHGVWGTAPYQSVHSPGANFVLSLLAMPEWYLAVAALALLSAGGLLWKPLLLALPLLALAVAARLTEAGIAAARAPVLWRTRGRDRLARWLVTSFLHLSQPLPRLYGRIRHGLTPWRCRVPARSRLPRRWSMAIWSERWQEPTAWVQQVRHAIGCGGARVNDGGPYDRWDLGVAGGALARARLLIAVEDHGAGTQYVRFGIRPKCSGAGLAAIAFFAAVAGAAATSAAWTAAAVFAGAAIWVIARIVQEAGRALILFEDAVAGIAKAAGARAK